MCAVIWVCDFYTSQKVAAYLLHTCLGWGIRKVCRELKLNDKSVRKYLALVEDARDDAVINEHLTLIEHALSGHSN